MPARPIFGVVLRIKGVGLLTTKLLSAVCWGVHPMDHIERFKADELFLAERAMKHMGLDVRNFHDAQLFIIGTYMSHCRRFEIENA